MKKNKIKNWLLTVVIGLSSINVNVNVNVYIYHTEKVPIVSSAYCDEGYKA